MVDARKLTLADLREIVADATELAKGAKVKDDGGLAHLSRFGGKLFADAAGSGAAPYKVQVLFEDKGIRGRCSCMASRSRPFCKHAAALLVAWAHAPESFAEAAAPPPGASPGEAKKKDVKRGKVDDKDLMARGIEQVGTLVRELGVSGVASLAADRVDQVRALGETLREAKLRRVSARTIELSGHLAKAAARSDGFDPAAYAELIGDLLLTIRKLEKHVGGEALADEHVEELIGKVWTKKDRKPIDGLTLVEYAFLSRTTADSFVIRESRFVDLASGAHFSEKQILPAFLVKRTDPKKSWTGRLLDKASGSVYPSFPPRRLDLETPGAVGALGPAALEALIEKALPDVGAALLALQERRRDIFAPDALPVALRVEAVLADGERLQVVDGTGAALFLPEGGPEGGEAAEALAAVLREGALAALVGDVALDGALPTLFPLAAIVRARRGLGLFPLGIDAAAFLESKKLRARAPEAPGRASTRWVDIARRVGVSAAAIALGEVRDEMAHALATGLSSVTPRFAEPLAARLRDLGLAKQADLLAATAAKNDPAEKLDDFVKLHQVLGIALARLAGASQVDRARLERVPGYDSVFIPSPERTYPPREIASLQAANRINRYQAAVYYDRHFGAMRPEEIAASVYPAWADGSASAYLARALAREPAIAIEAARRVLEADAGKGRTRTPRVAKLTAIAVLAEVGTDEAATVLAAVTRRKGDEALIAHARRALEDAGTGPRASGRDPEVDTLVRAVVHGSQKDERIRALRALGERAAVAAIPAMRASLGRDLSFDVREAAAYALAQLGDVDSVDTFVQLLRQRASGSSREAKVGAHVLGVLGDARGIDELLAAYAEGWQPGIVADAMRAIGPAVLEPLLTLIEAHPEIAERKAALGVIGALPVEDVTEALAARLDAASPADFCRRAALYVTIAGAHGDCATAIVKQIVRLRPGILDKKTSTSEEKALARKCAKYIQ
ncbi:MAG TPA: HEAT repeat domain-containing protein [Polyangia bacterium]|jgi:HEAT repeat protein